MSNPFFSALQGGGNRNRDPRELMQRLQRDPMGTLREAGLNLPQGMNDPRQIIQHLMNSGQLSQERLMQAQQIARRMGARF